MHEKVDALASGLAELRSTLAASAGILSTTELIRAKQLAAGADDPVTLLVHRLGQLEAMQSNMVAVLNRLEQPTVETPEQVAVRKESSRTILIAKRDEVDRDYDAAVQKVEELRVNLNIPDDLAVNGSAQGLDDPRLRQYRAYWEAKRDMEEKRRFQSIVRMKVTTDLLDLELPKSK